MLLHGVDLTNWPGAMVAAVHGEVDVEDTAEAFRESVRLLKREGDIAA
jgi:hypothetical protein